MAFLETERVVPQADTQFKSAGLVAMKRVPAW
jgi:hypothetical protein